MLGCFTFVFSVFLLNFTSSVYGKTCDKSYFTIVNDVLRNNSAITEAEKASCTAVELSNNNLLNLGVDVFKGFTNLAKLEVWGNRIGNLDANIFNGLTALTYLDLHENAIANLDANIFQGLPNLVYLDMYSNKVAILDANIFQGLTGLKYLDLYGNGIANLDANIFQGLTDLQFLDVWQNKIGNLDANIFNGLTALTHLNLRGNPIANLDANIFQGLSNLVYLNMYGIKAANLNANIFKGLTGLKLLDLYGNGIANLDANIFRGLTDLQSLDVTDNAIVSLDANIFQGLTGLTTLQLDNNLLVHLDSNIFNGLSHLIKLDLDNNQLTGFDDPTFFQDLTALLDLDFETNAITNYDANLFRHCTALTTLWLGINDVTSLDPNIFDGLTNLVQLSVDTLKVTNLDPNIFKNQIALTELWINKNMYTHLDPSILNGLTALTKLHLDASNLVNLDSMFQDQTALRLLYLQGNAISSFPKHTFEHMTQLNQLDLRGNPITYLPSNLPSSLFTSSPGLQLDATPVCNGYLFSVDETGELKFRTNENFHQVTSNCSSFDLANNDIKRIPKHTFDHMTQLNVLDLRGNNITYLPPDLPPSISSLLLDEKSKCSGYLFTVDQTGLLTLRNNAEVNQVVPQCVSINLTGYNIQQVPKETFDQMTQLSSLDLRGNNITYIPADLPPGLFNLPVRSLLLDEKSKCSGYLFKVDQTGLLTLRNNVEVDQIAPLCVSINLTDYGIERVAKYTFDQMTQLSVLDLMKNNITYIPSDLPPSVFEEHGLLLDEMSKCSGYLFTVNNGVLKYRTDVNASQIISQCTSLNLTDYEIEGMSKQARDDVVSMKILDLRKNGLGNILNNNSLLQDVEQNLINWRKLYLSNNEISELDAGIMYKLHNLTELYLNNNNITTINVNTFKYFDGNTLEIDNNPIDCCDSHLELFNLTKKKLFLDCVMNNEDSNVIIVNTENNVNLTQTCTENSARKNPKNSTDNMRTIIIVCCVVGVVLVAAVVAGAVLYKKQARKKDLLEGKSAQEFVNNESLCNSERFLNVDYENTDYVEEYTKEQTQYQHVDEDANQEYANQYLIDENAQQVYQGHIQTQYQHIDEDTNQEYANQYLVVENAQKVYHMPYSEGNEEPLPTRYEDICKQHQYESIKEEKYTNLLDKDSSQTPRYLNS